MRYCRDQAAIQNSTRHIASFCCVSYTYGRYRHYFILPVMSLSRYKKHCAFGAASVLPLPDMCLSPPARRQRIFRFLTIEEVLGLQPELPSCPHCRSVCGRSIPSSHPMTTIYRRANHDDDDDDELFSALPPAHVHSRRLRCDVAPRGCGRARWLYWAVAESVAVRGGWVSCNDVAARNLAKRLWLHKLGAHSHLLLSGNTATRCQRYAIWQKCGV